MLLGYAVATLANLIKITRQQAIVDGVRMLPPIVSSTMLGYFPATLLHRTRFATGGASNLPLPAVAFSLRDAVAITLDDVILFKTERLAQSDLELWAHELTHVMQYQRWGIDGFADRYVKDSAAVEQEAIDNAHRFMTWLNHGRN